MGWGIAHDFSPGERRGVTLVATALYARWSQYRDRHGQNPDGVYRWYDTLSGAVGARYRRGDGRAFVDLGYQPSPVPAQTGRTNYVDSTRVASSAGYDYGMRVLGTGVRVGLQAQVHRVLPRQTQKLAATGTTDATTQAVVDEVPDDAVVGGQPLAGRAGLQTNNPGVAGVFQWRMDPGRRRSTDSAVLRTQWNERCTSIVVILAVMLPARPAVAIGVNRCARWS